MKEAAVFIREAGSGDRDGIYSLVIDLGYSGLKRDEFNNAFELLLPRNDQWMLIAVDRDTREVLGLASMSERPQVRLGGSLVTIDEFVIRETRRGRGIGTALLAEAKNRAMKMGARRLQLDTNRTRESYLRGFYPKHGFAEADSAVMRIDFAK